MAKPCSTRFAIAIASVASGTRTSGSTGISSSSCTNGCFSSTSATSSRSSSPALTPIWRGDDGGVLADEVLVRVDAGLALHQHHLLERAHLPLVDDQAARCAPAARASASAIDATAMISFSAMQTMLLSSDAPSTMLAAATSRSAVSSTTAGGLPGPAAIAFLPVPSPP